MKQVTAIITTHNRKELLERAIKSVLAQTYSNMELIVVDDASDDGTDELCRFYELTYIYIPKNKKKGTNYARNLGIKTAKGDYVAFLDDDDYWLPEKIEKQVNLIESKDCELVYCGVRHEIISNNDISYRDIFPSSNNQGDMHKKILWTIPTTTSNILVKKDALYAIGLFDEKLNYWQETELNIRLAQRKPFYFVNEILCVYRVNINDPNRMTNKYHGWIKSVKYIHKKHKKLYKSLSFKEKYQVHMLITQDRCRRTKNAGMKFKNLFYRGYLRLVRVFYVHVLK